MAAAGQHDGAARRYDELAGAARGPQRDRLLLAAAQQWYAAGDLQRSERRAAGIGGAKLSRSENLEWLLLRARLADQAGDPASVLEVLGELPTPLSADVEWESLNLRAAALFALGRPLAAVQALSARARLARSDQERIANERAIWNGLLASASREALPEQTPGVDATVAAWLDLGRIGARASRNPFIARQELTQWRELHPEHPASRALIAEVLEQFRGVLDYPQQVAVILPLSGRQQAAAEAVRDGFMAAYFQHGEASTRPLVRLYDESALGGAGAYRRAVLEGADLVVGPLTKGAVQAVAQEGDGATPTLALNYLPDEVGAPGGFYQFGLAPEDEARQAARQMIDEGERLVVAFAPNNDWGRRLLGSFRDALEQHGGQLLDYRFYDGSGRDFSVPISDLLRLDESRARYRRLSGVLGVPLEFEPRRRGDIQAIFLAAEPALARLIRPQLKFFFAGDLPLYSNSSAYEPGAGSNADLDGVLVPDVPWLLAPDETATSIRASFERHWPRAPGSRSRLHALGFDAYRLVPLLYNSGGTLAAQIPGMTGGLTIDEAGRVHRDLAWARIENGQALPLQLAAEELPLP